MPTGGAAPIRVLLVDDSLVARRLVATVVDAEDGLSVSGTAANGRMALDAIAADRPDVVVLDLEMPELDGFEVLRILRRSDRTLPVIVFSNLSARGARATLDALALGATAYALKPQAGAADPMDAVRSELVPLVRALGSRRVAAARVRPDASPAEPGRSSGWGGRGATGPSTPQPVAAIVVGVSTGGPNALATLIGSLPASLAVPMLIVQHMPPTFTAMLAERLDRLGGPRVTEAVEDEPVASGHVYIAPGGRHLAVAGPATAARVSLNDGPPENSCRPAIDVLFRSAAQVYGPSLLAVVLTGMGTDGLAGSRAVTSAGGRVMAQEASSCVVSSMPMAVTSAGLADAVLPLEQIGPELVRRVSAVPERP